MSTNIINKETYCSNCGKRYTYTIEDIEYVVKGDWLGHHPDHTEYKTTNNLDNTPCPYCGKINKKTISLEELADIDIINMDFDEKYKYILSEKILEKEKENTKLEEEIQKLLKDKEECGEGIKKISKKIGENNNKIKTNEEIVEELEKISHLEYRIKEQNKIKKEIDGIEQININFRYQQNVMSSHFNDINKKISKLNLKIVYNKKEIKILELEKNS